MDRNLVIRLPTGPAVFKDRIDLYFRLITQVELRSLRYFVAVAEDEHFGRAACRLNISQSAVSTQIQNIEAELGATLFDRLARGVRLSPVGRIFLEDAHRILDLTERAMDRARKGAKGQIGNLRVACTEAAAWRGVAPNSLRLFRQKHPGVALEFDPMASIPQLQALREGNLDAGFLYIIDQTQDLSHLQRQLVHVNNAVLVLPRTHRLARRAHVKLKDLVSEEFVWPMRSRATQYFDRLMSACIEGGLTPNVVQEAASETTALNLIAAGMGIGILTSAIQWRRPEGVVFKQVSDLLVPLPLEFVWRKSDNSAVLANFVEIVRAEIDANTAATRSDR